LDWLETNKKYISFLTIFSGLIAAAGFWCLIENVLPVLICLGLTGAISFFYVVPIFGKSIRDLPGIKSFVIAFVWVLILFVLPAINEGQLTVKVLPELAAYFLFFIALTIPFDIRDLKYDHPKQKTLPQVLGTEGSKILATLLIMAFTITLIILKAQFFWNPIFLGASLLAMLLILGTNESRKEGYFALIDCVMIILGISYFY
jgi:4-hydroxybenzoate polyprenyltransferase